MYTRGIFVMIAALIACGPADDGVSIGDINGLESACDLDNWGPELEIAYVLDVAENAVHAVNPRMCRAFETIPVGEEPVVANTSPSGTWVYVGNRGSRSMTIINTDYQSVHDTVPLDFAPSGMRFDPGHRYLWIMGEGKAARFDIIEETLGATFDIDGQTTISTVTTTGEDRVYLGSPGSNHVTGYRGADGSVIAQVPLDAPLRHFDYSAASAHLYACTDQPELEMIPVQGVVTDIVTGSIALDAPCDRVTIDRAGEIGIALHGDQGKATVFDASTNTVIEVLDLGGHPDEVIFRPGAALIGNRGSGEMSMWSLDTHQLVEEFSLGTPGESWDLRRENRRSVHDEFAYFVNPEDGTLTVFDVQEGAIRGTVEVGTQPISVIVAGPLGGTCC